MKRHPSLQDLSREHHDALKLALQARRAADSSDQPTIQRVGAECVRAFKLALEPHFLVEETKLLPLLLVRGEDELARRLQLEHLELRALAVKLQHPCIEDLATFSTRLTAHVRFEEREMFAVLEPGFEAPAA